VSLRFLIDTDILIYLRQRRSLQVVARFRAVQAGDAAMSVITHGELLYGAERSRERERSLKSVSDLTSLVPVLALPEDTGIEYGRIRAELEGRGIPIGNNDLWIASHARVAGLILVTNNEKEFRRISGLKIENWASKK
jgi:tRNA(fMet)-specific endonuclease VapC